MSEAITRNAGEWRILKQTGRMIPHPTLRSLIPHRVSRQLALLPTQELYSLDPTAFARDGALPFTFYCFLSCSNSRYALRGGGIWATAVCGRCCWRNSAACLLP